MCYHKEYEPAIVIRQKRRLCGENKAVIRLARSCDSTEFYSLKKPRGDSHWVDEGRLRC